jgi:phage tail-like protein
VDNFDVMLDPRTAPAEYLPWLASWFSVTFDASWTEEQQRLLLTEAHQLFARRGTHWALSRLLEIYLGEKPEIDDQDDKADPFTFTVKIPFGEDEVDRELIERMVDASKPAHTSYSLLFKQSGRKRTRGR